MKKQLILSAFVLLLATVGLNAKGINFLAYGKVAYYEMQYEVDGKDLFEDSNSGTAFGVGGQVELELLPAITVSGGLEYFASSYDVGIKTNTILDKFSTYEVTDAYLSIPLIANFWLSGTSEGFFFGTGPRFSYYMEDDDEGFLNAAKKTLKKMKDEDNMDDFLVSIMANAGYQLKAGLRVSAILDYSLTNLSAVEMLEVKPFFVGGQISWRF